MEEMKKYEADPVNQGIPEKYKGDVEKKPRKKRVPKAKPPKKPRVSMGGIQLATVHPFSGEVRLLPVQPPADIANDAQAVERWAATQDMLVGQVGIKMIRVYNATLVVEAETKIRAGLVIKPEVKDEQVAPSGDAVQ